MEVTKSSGFSSSSKYQDKIKGFNERFVMVLVRHVERYLTKIGIDMGIDEKNIYRAATNTLASAEEKEVVSESLEVIEVEAAAEKPKKSMLKTAIASLQTVKGAAEFGAAVAALIQFVGPML